MFDLKVGLHVFMVVLVFGTVWRLTQYHLSASGTPWVQHLGTAMAVQY